MKKLKLLSEGVLYKNPNPGFKVECAFLPNIVPLSDTELICFYRLGSAFYSVDGKLAKLRSTDGGETWFQEEHVWDAAGDDIPYNYSAPHGTLLRDGSMVLVAFRVDFVDPEVPMYNPETGGWRPVETVLFRSEDHGHTWSEPELVDFPYQGTAAPPSQVIELNDGRWLLTGEHWKAWDDVSPLHIKTFSTFSDDRGKTWSGPVEHPSASDAEKMFSHGRHMQLLDGRVAALQWTQDVGASKDFDLHLTTSDEAASTWSHPQPTGIMGQTSWLVDLGGGLLVAAYTRREGMSPGIMVVLSEDEGKTWDLDNQVMVWDAVGQEYLGVEQRPEYPASHDNIAFGKPNAVRLPNGEIMCSWWCTQACVTHARYARLATE